MGFICNECFLEVKDDVEVSEEGIEEQFAERCESCGCEVWGEDAKEIIEIYLSEEMRDSIRSSILGCWNHGCGRIWDSVDDEWVFSELNATLEDVFCDSWCSLENKTYKQLIDDVDLINIEFPEFTCPKCGIQLESWYDDVKVKAFIRVLPSVPRLPKELRELTASNIYERIEFFRPDCSRYLIHLTKPNRIVEGHDNEEYEDKVGNYNAPETLFIILKGAKIKKEKGRGMYAEAVCFTEKSLTALKETLFGEESSIRSKGSGISWFPYGLMFEKEYLQDGFDVQTVINLNQDDLDDFKSSNSKMLYRVVKNTRKINWLHEREWRTSRSVKFDTKEAIVVVPTYEQALEFKKILDAEDIEVKGFLPILDISSAI